MDGVRTHGRYDTRHPALIIREEHLEAETNHIQIYVGLGVLKASLIWIHINFFANTQCLLNIFFLGTLNSNLWKNDFVCCILHTQCANTLLTVSSYNGVGVWFTVWRILFCDAGNNNDSWA